MSLSAARTGDHGRPRDVPGHPLLVPRRERPAGRFVYCDGRRRGDGRQCRGRTCDADAPRTDRHQRRSFDRAGTAGTAHPPAPRFVRAAGHFDRKPCGDDPHRDNRRCRAGACANSMPATAAVPIRVQLDDSARGDRSVLERMRVPMGGGGGSVPLLRSATSTSAQGPISIIRFDRARQATVEADLVGSAGAWRCVDSRQGLAGDEEPAAGHQGRGSGRRRNHGGAV